MYSIYKTEGLSLFLPDNLVCMPFLLPKSLNVLLNGMPSPYFFVFEGIPSSKTVKEYGLDKVINLQDVESKEELRETMKDISFWRLLLMF